MGNLTSTLSVRLNDDISGPAGKAAGALRGLGGAGDSLKKLAAASPEAARLVKQLEALRAKAAQLGEFKSANSGLGVAGRQYRAAGVEAEKASRLLVSAQRRVEFFERSKAKGSANYSAFKASGLVDAADKDLRAAKRRNAEAQKLVASTQAAHVEQKRVVGALGANLTSAGVSIKGLGAAEAGLKASIDATNAALAKQPALMAQAAARAEQLAQASRAALKATVDAGRVARSKRANASADMLSGMGASGRAVSARIDAGRRLADGMSAPSRRDHAARLKADRDAAKAERVASERAEREAAAARAERRKERGEAAGALGAGVAVVTAHKTKEIAKDAITSAADFDLAVRKQRVFTDIDAGDQDKLLSQAKKIGQETQFSNIDVVKAQTAAMQGLPAGFTPKLKAEVAEGIVGNVRNFSTLMETDLKDGTEIIRGYLQQSGKDISDKQKALFEANKATNQLVKMAKLGGMDGEDVKNYVNYAVAPGTAAGLSPESLMSLGALARRGGLRGDVAGVAVRSMASKIVAPTSKGLAALNAAGVNHSDYVKMPDSVSTNALEGQFRMKLGKGFTPKIRKDLDKINSNKELLADSGKYTEAVTKAVGDILGKTKGGKVRASDSQKAAKAAFEFHKVSAQSVDAEGLLDAAFKAKMTLPQLNAWLTDKHGGKGAITQRQWDEYHASREQIGKAADDPDWAKKKADEVFAGLGGAVENLKGSFENLVLTVGNANAGLIKATADRLGSGLDSFSQLPEGAQQGLSLTAGAGALIAGWWGSLKLVRLALGIGGKTAAATAGAAGASSAAAGGAAAGSAGVAGAAAAGGLATGAILGGGVVAGAAMDAATPGTNAGIVGAITGAESSLQQTMRVLREERAASASTRAARVPAGWEDGPVRSLPGGADPSAGLPTSMPRSRGVVGDFLFGQDKTSVAVPGFGAGIKASMSELDGAITETGAKLKALGSEPVAPHVDTAPLDGLGNSATAAGEKLAGLNTTVSPQVDTASLSSALALVTEFLAKLAQIGPQIASAKSQAASLAVPSAGGGGGAPAPQRTGAVRRGTANNFA